MKKVFAGPSLKQKLHFLEMSGYSYEEKAEQESFKTDRPYGEPWDQRPWDFSYKFDTETGYLYCELSHRMTNNRTAGWDRSGEPLPSELIDAVFPPHL